MDPQLAPPFLHARDKARGLVTSMQKRRRYLGSVGTVVNCHTLVDAVPSLQNLDAEACCAAAVWLRDVR
eukprot:gene16690-22829_t